MLKEFIKKEIVLIIAWVLALVSMVWVPVDKAYIDYIDYRTLSLLLCLMLVVAGFGKSGFFTYIGSALLNKFKGIRSIIMVLVLLCFVFSMLITNDVALITFVPFAVVVLRLAGGEAYIIPTLVLQTIGANLGSMLTPMGNPQNLYLYGRSGFTAVEFMKVTLPFTIASAVLLLLCIMYVKNSALDFSLERVAVDFKGVGFYSALFIICFLSVVNVLDYRVLLAIITIMVLIKDRQLFKGVDYSLLFTFVGFFIFIGNMGRMEEFSSLMSHIVEGNEVMTAILSSQIISNVPSALLLSGFSNNWSGLIIGVNLGGLGTLIASMASLISYKLLAKDYPQLKKRYLAVFTVANIVFLVLLYGFYMIIK